MPSVSRELCVFLLCILTTKCMCITLTVKIIIILKKSLRERGLYFGVILYLATVRANMLLNNRKRQT